MSLYHNKYRIESTRLKNWDYSSGGYYFITIRTYSKIHYFGDVVNSKMEYSEIGKNLDYNWLKIEKRFKNVSLDVFQTTPNHIHGIIIMRKNISCVETCQRGKKSSSSNTCEFLKLNDSVNLNDGISLRVIENQMRDSSINDESFKLNYSANWHDVCRYHVNK